MLIQMYGDDLRVTITYNCKFHVELCVFWWLSFACFPCFMQERITYTKSLKSVFYMDLIFCI